MKIRNFNKLAKYYDFLLFMFSGRLIRNSQLQLLSSVPKVQKVLIAGGGTGTFLLDFLKSNHPKKIVYIDSSSEMIALSKKRIEIFDKKYLKNIEFICNEIEQFEPQEKFDLIVTNFFLDLFEGKELDLIVKKLSNCLEVQGYWYYTDFQKVERPWLKKYIINSILKMLYIFFRTTCHIKAEKLGSVKEIFSHIGLEKIISKESFFGFINTVLYRKANQE